MTRIAAVVFLAAALAVFSPAGITAEPIPYGVVPLDEFVPTGPLQAEDSHGEYRVRIYRNDFTASYEILRGNDRVYAEVGHYFSTGDPNRPGRREGVAAMGDDITGDGRANLVIVQWTGGAHCCFILELFEIDEEFRHIQTIDLAHTGYPDFRDLDGEPGLELILNDWAFEYWRTSFVNSPAPELALKFTGGKYAVDPELNRRPPLEGYRLANLAAAIASAEEWGEGGPPVRLWAEMLDLIYSGNMEQAWELFELAWPRDVGGKEEFAADFRETLARSRYWNDVQRMQ